MPMQASRVLMGPTRISNKVNATVYIPFNYHLNLNLYSFLKIGKSQIEINSQHFSIIFDQFISQIN